ncbi:MAG: DUF3054 domain-containing protein [Chloroflexota bacterium]|nr:DUF3054 domain-containing protein [Chloroflexota bacterium]
MLTPTFSNSQRLLLIVGDLATFLAFAALGRRAHSMGSALDDIVGTALPFILAWAAVAPFTGAYGLEATGDVAQGVKRTALTWLLAFPLGLLIRIPLVGHVAHPSFAIVAGVFTLIMLTGWRGVFARLTAPEQ